MAFKTTNNAIEFTEVLRDVVDEEICVKSPAALQIIEAIYVWLGNMLQDFML